ncbi:MAG: HAMP domain-containing protein [Magnetococcales bacterium]|nr:HAMP domain-containing protein [Magnetococcales bacterium]
MINKGGLTIKFKMLAVFATIAVVSLFSTMTVIFILGEAEEDAARLNALGRQRMLTQAMAKSVLGFSMAKGRQQTIIQQIRDLDKFITKMRGTYTKTVVKAAKQGKWSISMTPLEEPHPAVPFPATFTRLVNQAYGTDSKISMEIISEAPLNLSQELNGPIDKAANEAIKKDPKKIFISEPLKTNKGLFIRYYTADLAVAQGCADCHTRMSGTPFKLNDLLGIRRYVFHFSENIPLGMSELNPSLNEYKNAREVFVQTLSAMKSGGKYPLDLQQSNFGKITAVKDAQFQEKIIEIERDFDGLIKVIDALFSSKVGSIHYRQAQLDILEQSNKLRLSSDNLVDLYQVLANSKQQTIYWATLITGILLLVIVVGATVFLNANVIRPIGDISSILKRVGEGDFTVSINPGKPDEIGLARRALQNLVNQLSGSIGEIIGVSETLKVYSESLKNVSNEIQTTSSKLEENSITSSSSAEMMNSTMANVAESSKHASNNLNAVSTVADQSSSNMSSISAAAEQATTNLSAIQEAAIRNQDGVVEVSKSASEIASASEGIRNLCRDASQKSQTAVTNVNSNLEAADKLNKSVKDIDQTISLIKKIANQTNMLALNASIEAANAGETGMGFAVVANEVKDLANQTSEATNMISEKINDIQNNADGMSSLVKTISEVVDEIGKANNDILYAVDEQGEFSKSISESMSNVANDNKEVTRRISEASHGIDEVTRNVASSSTSIEEMALSVREAAESNYSINEKVEIATDSSKEIVETLLDVKQLAEDGNKLSHDVGDKAKEIAHTSEVLISITSNFKI